ncbi:MAG: glycosyltransferase family 2 protein [Gemmatimonadetes bacterium]|nr:glycosyltransferase family 2 protein [Gemmatimonadota bacterium]
MRTGQPESADNAGESTSLSKKESAGACELSVVIPCYNEAETVARCIAIASKAMSEHGILGEVVVADNRSSDGSAEIARKAGARVVLVTEPGYGNALLGGIEAARGGLIVMGDADGSYDFAEIPAFVEKLRGGFDLVQGCRMPAGGGRVAPNAMPFAHRWIGNPLLSHLVRRWFDTPVHDVQCGLRGFRRELVERLDLRCSGMEFASEMVVKAALAGVRTAEIPITLHPDGRIAGRPHLRTFRDGWRNLRFMLLFSPRWLFVIPGTVLGGLGLVAAVAGYVGVEAGPVRFDVHTLLVGCLLIIVGYQAAWFSVLAKEYGRTQGLLPGRPRIRRGSDLAGLEAGLLAGLAGIVSGVAMIVIAVLEWRATGFGDLDYSRTMRWVIPGAALTTVGFQTVLGSFFLSILELPHR